MKNAVYRTPAPADPAPPPQPKRSAGTSCLVVSLLITATLWVALQYGWVLLCVGDPVLSVDTSKGPIGMVPYVMLAAIGIVALVR